MLFRSYKGTGPVVTDLVGGHVQLTLVPPIATVSHIKSGKLRGLAVSGEHRLTSMPDVPTFTEAGLPGFEMKNWNGLLAPAGTPRTIIGKLATEVARIVVLPDFREKLVSQGLEPLVSTPAGFSALIKDDLSRFTKVIKAVGMRPED